MERGEARKLSGGQLKTAHNGKPNSPRLQNLPAAVAVHGTAMLLVL
jgi:hypothetical protein